MSISSINLVLRSALLRASRRTVRGKAPASILRDAVLRTAPQDEVRGIIDAARYDRFHGNAALVFGFGKRVLDELTVIAGQVHRPELEGQLGDLAREAERHLIVRVVYRRSGVDADIEGLVD